MPRRFNYTGRKRVNREDCLIQLVENDRKLTFDANIRLAGYGLETLAPPPRVFIEAYRGASSLWRRFDFGTAGAVTSPANRSLADFGTGIDVLFRLKVTSEGVDKGKLLASADQISPTLPDGKRPSLPLISHIASDDIGHELWRVEFDEHGSHIPVLKVNNRVPMGVDQFVIDPEFRALFAPVVMRQVLSRILIVDRDLGDEDDESDWRQRWVRFSESLSGVPECPGILEKDGSNFDGIDSWITGAVEAFAKQSGLLDRFCDLNGAEVSVEAS